MLFLAPSGGARKLREKFHTKEMTMKLFGFIRWDGLVKLIGVSLLIGLSVAHSQPASQGPERPDASWTPIDGNSVIATAGVGTLYTDVFGSNDFGKAMVVLPDFGVIMAGHCFYPPLGKDTFCAARYDATGNLVTSWGTNSGKMVASISTSNDQANAAVLQPDGKLVLGGLCWDGANNKFCVARFTANGDSFDTTFNGTGIAITSIGDGDDRIASLVLQADGRIVASGSCATASGSLLTDFCAARYNPDGSLDSSFGSGGKILIVMSSATDYSRGHVDGMAIDAVGRIVLVGTCRFVNTSNTVCVARVNADGSPDTSFNSTGIREIDVPGDTLEVGTAIVIQPDGRIVLGGSANSDFLLIRLSSGGALDARFAPTSPLGAGMLRVSMFNRFEGVGKLALQPDGKILAAGFCSIANVLRNEFCLARLHSDGNLDESFATGSAYGNGKLVLPMGAGAGTTSGVDSLSAIQVLRDGRIMLGGSCFIGGNVQFCSARLLGSTFQRAWRNCSTDIDGDGKFLATTDGLINARVAFGLTGTAVTNGITFAPSSQRNTWSAIRNYLIEDCGLSIP
jgi:uncharacterized delta-60 repeat protein